MSAWFGGVGVGLYLGIVGTVLVLMRLQKKRIRRPARTREQALAEFGKIFAPQLAPRTRDADAVDELVGPQTYREMP